MNGEARIWAPAVKQMPVRQTSNASDFATSSTKIYSKTSLEANDQIRNNYQKLNREILTRTQSFNSTPKPFNSSTASETSSLKPLAPVELKMHKSSQAHHASSSGVEPRQTETQVTEQKQLVHKQYNSPLNLYSMDNIRKSIEAHTEMIKPGVKGINFMKPEAPINKESELYRLIKEEEEAASKLTSPIQRPKVSPISGEPLKMILGKSASSDNFNAGSPLSAGTSRNDDETIRSALPICSECGLAIIGPFARVMNRDIHAHCFNCTTCGTSLKNVGFFTVNEKLYCDIHAKQVANALHLNYDFAKTTANPPQPTLVPSSSRPSRDQQVSPSPNKVTHLNPLLKSESSLQKKPTFSRVPVCSGCAINISGPYIMAGQTTWCKPCSQTLFRCQACERSLINLGFIEDSSSGKHYCEQCYDAYFAPTCNNCNLKIKGDCLNALDRQWHPSCFVCGNCRRPFGNSSFYLEDDVPYCERDWNLLFTTKCSLCGLPIEAGNKWIEALDKNYHAGCFRCTSCKTSLEGSVFYCKAGEPYCRSHART